jgi:hypothetical protein
LCQLDRALDIAILRSLVAAAEQNDDKLAATDEINAVSRAVIDSHLRYAASDRLHVAWIAER